MTTQEPAILEQTPVEERTSFTPSEPLEEASFSNLLGILKRRAWWILGVTLLFLLLGFLYAMRQTVSYTAQALASLNVDTAKGPSLAEVSTTLPSGADSDLRLQSELLVLQSDNVALDVINQLHLERAVDFRPALPASAGKAAEDHLLGVWHSLLKVRVVPKTKLIEISFTSRDPQTAADAANAVLVAYATHSQQAMLQSSEQSTRFLSSQLADARKRAEDAERSLIEYQTKEGVVLLPGAAGDQSAIESRVGDLNQAYTAAQVNRIQREAHYREVQSKDPDALAASMAPGSVLAELRGQQASAARELAAESERHGSEWPQVKQLRLASQQTDRSIQAEVQRTLNQVRDEYVSSEKAEETLKSQLDQAKAEALKTSAGATQLKLREQEATGSRELYDNLLHRLNEVGIVAGLQTPNLQVIDSARVPAFPSSTPRRTYLLSFLAAGLFFGLATALLLNAIADTINTAVEAREVTGIPVLGGIPNIEAKKNPTDVRDKPSQVTLRMPRSRAAEAFHSLRTSLLLSNFKSSPQVIAVTSATLGEGKSLTSLNLAIVLAQRGARVLLIDADMRRGTQHENTGVARDPGLSDFLAGTRDLHSVIQTIGADIPLSILAAGPPPPQPADLLDSLAFTELLHVCRKAYDYIVIDTPPAVLVSDPLIVARACDGVLLIVRSGVTERRALARTGQLLAPISHKVLGLILNGDPELSRNYGRASSYYTYYEEAK